MATRTVSPGAASTRLKPRSRRSGRSCTEPGTPPNAKTTVEPVRPPVFVTSTDATSSSTDPAELAGPDIGSPVLRIDGASRGFHGPIVSPRVTGEAGTRLFDAIAVLQAEPALFELKRGRSTRPVLGAVR